MYDEEKCSVVGDNNFSCLSIELLHKIGDIMGDMDICDKINKECSDKEYYDKLCNNIKKLSNCKEELCWLNISDIISKLSMKDKNEIKNNFKPIMPNQWKKKPYTWLNTRDIDNVLERYSKKYDTCKYWGAIPIDWHKKKEGECIVSDLCKINVSELLNSYDSMAVVFNTDPHQKDGEHWFSVYVDFQKKNLNILLALKKTTNAAFLRQS